MVPSREQSGCNGSMKENKTHTDNICHLLETISSTSHNEWFSRGNEKHVPFTVKVVSGAIKKRARVPAEFLVENGFKSFQMEIFYRNINRVVVGE